jgi:hypothetical protein
MLVSDLKDIIQSQLCVHGDHALYFRNREPDKPAFTLRANGKLVLDCEGFGVAIENIGEYGLKAVAARLDKIDEEVEITCGDEEIQMMGFDIGFVSKYEGFVQVIDSNELSDDFINE